MKLFVKVLSLVILWGLGKAATICPNGAVPSLNDATICYSFLSSSTEFLNAEQTCVDLGGHLASIDSAFTDTFLNRRF